MKKTLLAIIAYGSLTCANAQIFMASDNTNLRMVSSIQIEDSEDGMLGQLNFDYDQDGKLSQMDISSGGTTMSIEYTWSENYIEGYIVGLPGADAYSFATLDESGNAIVVGSDLNDVRYYLDYNSDGLLSAITDNEYNEPTNYTWYDGNLVEEHDMYYSVKKEFSDYPFDMNLSFDGFVNLPDFDVAFICPVNKLNRNLVSTLTYNDSNSDSYHFEYEFNTDGSVHKIIKKYPGFDILGIPPYDTILTLEYDTRFPFNSIDPIVYNNESASKSYTLNGQQIKADNEKGLVIKDGKVILMR